MRFIYLGKWYIWYGHGDFCAVLVRSPICAVLARSMTAPKVDHDVPYPNTAHKFTFGTVLGGMISHLVRSTQPVCTFGMVIQYKELLSPNCCDLVLRFGTMGKKTGSKQKEVAAAVSGKQGPVVATTRTTRRALEATAPPGSSQPEISLRKADMGHHWSHQLWAVS